LKQVLFSILFLVLSFPAFAQARKAQSQRLTVVSRDFTITNFGAVGDGQVATDCSMANGSPVLTCGGSRFVAEDVGKVVAVYGAGILRNGYRQPLAATITTYLSASQITLSANAQADVINSERVLWGTNNTAAIQAAVNAAADAGGGLVFVPDGLFLTEGAYLDCSTIGNFPGYGYGPCIRAYNNISIKGSSALTSILENWNPDVQTIGGVIDLGKGAEIPGFGVANWPPKRLANIEISNLTIRQVKYPTRPVKIISAYATEDVSIHDCYLFGYSYEGVYMGGGFKSIRWRVFNNVAYEIGKGGPAYGNTTSAYNLNGSYVEAFGNKASNCGQCFESGSRHSYFYNNFCENSVHSFLLGSTGSGVWDVTISGNVLRNNYYALVAGNGNGTLHSIRFVGNTMIDTPDINFSFGANTNTVNEVETDTLIHGQSVISDNVFTFTDARHAARSIFRFFQNPTFVNVGSENLTVADNTITFAGLPTGPVLQIGGQGGYKWEPGRAFALNAPAVSSMWSGYWYKATNAGVTGVIEPIWPQGQGQTVTDGTITWLCMGARPQIHFYDNRVILPGNIPASGSLYSTWPGAIRIDYGVREMLKVNNFQLTGADWRLMVVSPDMHEEIVPRDAPYSDTNRYSYSFGDAEPRAGFWSFGTRVSKRTLAADGTYGWIVTRAGYAALPYSATASYSAFGTFAKPTTDNGFVYQLIAGSCSNTAEPVWPTVINQTVISNGCTWKTAAVSARFTPLR
jgi:hypothetical protein